MANSAERPGRFSQATALRIAWREARSSWPKFAFVILAVAVGVGVLTGVRGFSGAFRGMLLREARTLMAADVMVRTFQAPTPQQLEVLANLQGKGLQLTRITETISMLSSDQVTTPLLVSVKAVEPDLYPFYGELQLDPPAKLAERLTAETVAVSEDLELRLNAGVGDYVKLGAERFQIIGVVKLEPDRMTGSLNIGPRIMITRDGLDRAGLLRVGSRASERYLFRLSPRGPSVDQVRSELVGAFRGRGALVTDFREVHPRIERGLNRSTTFLSLVSLIAMMIGALGVAMAMHSHIQQRLDTIAIMKCLGARSSQIIRIYLVQTILLGLAGALLGVLFGIAVQATFPGLIERYFQIRPERVFDLPSAAQGIALGILATLLFTLSPLLRIRHVRPAVIFRREMAEARRDLRSRWQQARASVLAGAITLLGVGLIAASLAEGDRSEAIRTSLIFMGALLVSLLALSAVAWVLLRVLRAILRMSFLRLPALLRHGIANLYRPGNHATAVLVALGIGVTFILTVYLLQRNMLTELLQSAPRNMPNVFMINIAEREREGLLALLRQQRGLESQPEIFASVRARLLSVDGTPVSQLQLEAERRFRRERSVTWMAEKPSHVTVAEGSWWDQKRPSNAPPELCVADRHARTLGLKQGARLDWVSGGVQFSASVACIHRGEEEEFGADLDFVFSPGALSGVPTSYFGSVRVRPQDVAALQRAAYASYPTVTVINAADVLAIVQEVVDQIALVVRFVAIFAILAGVIILAANVASTRFRRIREAAILKTLGATRRRVVTVFSIEFLILGVVAGIMGSLLASGFSRLLLTRMLESPFRFEVLPNAVAILLTAVIASGAGWLASYRILGQKPLEVLRNE